MQGTATNLGTLSRGSTTSRNANVTPGNPDWFTGAASCSGLFVFCSPKITVSGGAVSVTIFRDDGEPLSNGVADPSSFELTSHQYFVEVQGNYKTYLLTFENT